MASLPEEFNHDVGYRRTIAEVWATITTVFAEVDAWFDRPAGG